MSHGPRVGNFGRSWAELSPSYFPNVFSSVHHVHTSVSLPLPKLFPAVSRPSTMSTLPSRSLFPSYFPRFPVRPPCPTLPRAISHTASVRAPCRRFCVAPSHWSSPQAISHGFPSVHPVVASVSLPCGKVNQTRTQASEMLLGKKVEGPMLKGNSISNVLNLPCVQGYPTIELKPQIIQNI